MIKTFLPQMMLKKHLHSANISLVFLQMTLYVNTIQDYDSLHTNASSSCLLSDLDIDEYEIV